MTTVPEKRPSAGFWHRLAALWIDAVVIYLAVTALIVVFRHLGIYMPFELTFIVAAMAYSVPLVSWKGRTLGKALCGVFVYTAAEKPVGLIRGLARETAGKFLSGAMMFAGFLWVVFSRSKKGWHDYLAGTVVVRDPAAEARGRIALLVSLAIALGLVGLYGCEVAKLYRLYRHMAPPPNYALPFASRDPSGLTEVSFLSENDDARFVEWLNRAGQDPLEYAVAKAKAHQVVIFGELHEQRQPLRFLNALIPVLYQRAGVTCVGMEVCLAQDNARLERLVTAPKFDRDLAMEIARHQPWGLWGFRDYWDVFETVWRLNQAIPPGQPKVKVIGLDLPIDLPSIAMIGIERNAGSNCPAWEKLRVLRLPWLLPRAAVRDAFMARQVEEQMIETGRRGIVWVGSTHSCIHCPRPGYSGGGEARMGFMLHQKHGEKLFQIVLHRSFFSLKLLNPAYSGPAPVLTDFLERIMRRRAHAPVGFDVESSPFARLRDSACWDYHGDRRLSFADLATGYIYLVDVAGLKKCEWMPGYISQEMFVANKPFYQSFGRAFGASVESARDINEVFARAYK